MQQELEKEKGMEQERDEVGKLAQEQLKLLQQQELQKLYDELFELHRQQEVQKEMVELNELLRQKELEKETSELKKLCRQQELEKEMRELNELLCMKELEEQKQLPCTGQSETTCVAGLGIAGHDMEIEMHAESAPRGIVSQKVSHAEESDAAHMGNVVPEAPHEENAMSQAGEPYKPAAVEVKMLEDKETSGCFAEHVMEGVVKTTVKPQDSWPMAATCLLLRECWFVRTMKFAKHQLPLLPALTSIDILFAKDLHVLCYVD